MKPSKNIFLLCLLLLPVCGGSGGTETGNTEVDEIAAAMDAVFSGDSETSSLKSHAKMLAALLVREAKAQAESRTACDSLNSVGRNDPEIVVTGTITAGAYGVPSNQAEVEVSDGCDEGGLYASFVVTSHSFICTGSEGETTVTMDSGEGIWREDEVTGTDIFGTFNMTTASGSITGIRCTLTISRTEEGSAGEIAGDCVDSDDQVLEQSTDSSCRDDS
ncbi:MAG: hypothetical protein Q7T11_01655 [Deltaproteobacteria bacterium]|nr:hypothetical protein [Deltaproteobacteria bacterium]